MKNSYLNNLMSSFYLWLDHEILTQGEAFVNYTGNLYSSSDPSFDGISSIYSSPFRQWVYDSSVPGATIPSGVYVNGTSFIPRSTSGLALDYNKGRAIFSNNIINGLNASAGFAYKDYNIYYTDEKEEKLLFENSYSLSSYIQGVTGALAYDELPFPCIFVKNKATENSPFAFGGQNNTDTRVRCIILASNSFSMDSLISISADTYGKNFPIFSPGKLPFNYLGDFKTPVSGFNYDLECESIGMNDLCYIKKVSVSKLDESINANTSKKSIAALIDFDLTNIRSTS
jgi:hypothetical protein